VIHNQEFDFVRPIAFGSELRFKGIQLPGLGLTKSSAGRIERQHRRATRTREFESGFVGPCLRFGANLWFLRIDADDEERGEEERGKKKEEEAIAIFCIW